MGHFIDFFDLRIVEYECLSHADHLLWLTSVCLAETPCGEIRVDLAWKIMLWMDSNHPDRLHTMHKNDTHMYVNYHFPATERKASNLQILHMSCQCCLAASNRNFTHCVRPRACLPTHGVRMYTVLLIHVFRPPAIGLPWVRGLPGWGCCGRRGATNPKSLTCDLVGVHLLWDCEPSQPG